MVLLLVALGFALRALRLDFQPLWWDEGYSVWFATHPLPELLSLTAADIHPPLYYILLRGWIGAFGPGPVALRMFSVFVGTATIPVIYVAARRMLTLRVAWLAAFLLTISPLHIYYSQEVRMYGLAMLLGLGALLAGWETLEGRGGAEEPPHGGFRRGSKGAAGEQGAGVQAGEGASGRPPGDQPPGYPAAPPEGGLATDEAGLVRRGVARTFHVRAGSAAAQRRGFKPTADAGESRLPVLADGPGKSAVRAASMRDLLLYVALATAALYTLYYAALIPIGLTIYAMLRSVVGPRAGRLPGRILARWLAAQAAVALLYLPWLLYAAPRLVPYVNQKIEADADRSLSPLTYAARHLSAFAAGHLEGPLAHYWPLALLLLIPLGIGLYRYWLWSRGRALATLAIILIVALTLGWLVGLRFPFFPPRGERLLLIVLPAFLMLVAAGVDGLLRDYRSAGYITLGLIGALAGASLTAFYLEPRYAEDDYRPIIARTVEQGLPDDTVFAVYPWQVGYWRSYGHPDGPAAVLSPDATWGAPVMAALDDALARGRVWFPAHLSLGGILESRAEAYLAYKATPFLNQWFGAGTRLSAWGHAPPGDPAPWAPVRIGPVELASVRAAREPVPAANALTGLALRWRADAKPPPLSVSVRLTDALGQIWAQHDYEPLGGLGMAAWPDEPQCSACTGQKDAPTGPWNEEDAMGLLIPAGTPPGDYRVELVVHPVGDDRPLEASSADGASLGTAIPLYSLKVAPAGIALDPARLPIAARAETNMANGLRFLGHTAEDAPAAPGETRKVSLFWQAVERPQEDAVAFLQLLDSDDRVVAGWEAPPGAAYPTSHWAPRTLIRTQAALRVPAGLADGRYRLIAGLYRAGDKSRVLTEDDADHLQLATLAVSDRKHEMNPSQPQHLTDATFDGVARLVGYDLPVETVAPGGELSTTLHWQALGATDRPYTVFVHLVDEAGNIRGYGDSEPGGGQFPTTGWLSGEYIADAHTVTVAVDAPSGTYRLEAGLYDPTTGQRLLTADGADRVALDTEVTVSG